MDELSEAFRCFLFPLLGLVALFTLWNDRVQAQKRKSMLERQGQSAAVNSFKAAGSIGLKRVLRARARMWIFS